MQVSQFSGPYLQELEQNLCCASPRSGSWDFHCSFKTAGNDQKFSQGNKSHFYLTVNVEAFVVNELEKVDLSLHYLRLHRLN